MRVTVSPEQWRTRLLFNVLSRMSFVNRFLRSSREPNELFLGAASAISRPEIFEVSIAGRRFLYQNKSENHAMLKMFVEHTRLKYNLSVVSGISIVDFWGLFP